MVPLNDVAGDAAPFVLPDQRAIYFVSSKGGNADIYRAERGDGAWRAAAPVTGIDLPQARELRGRLPPRYCAASRVAATSSSAVSPR
jgi:hypothetical protein